ncbi:MAG: ATP-grasp domain-containing protein, partial [Nitrososphaerota archaeon]
MVRLYEYQAKALLKKIGLLVPEGDVVSDPRRAREVAEKLSKPVVLKPQVWVGGRGKAGGIKFAESPEEAEKLASDMI